MSSSREESKPRELDTVTTQYPTESGTFGSVLSSLHTGLVAPSDTTYDSIRELLNADSEEERDRLTIQWRDHKLAELNFIGIVGALLAGCLTSTGSWPTILPNGSVSPWPVRVCWYTGIIFSLFSVLSAAQQTLRLHRLSAHKNALSTIRRFMGTKHTDREGGTTIKPRRLQVYGWQVSQVFLILSVLALIVGMAILIWSSTQFGPFKLEEEGWWDHNAMLAVTWSIVTLVTIVVFVAAQATLAIRS